MAMLTRTLRSVPAAPIFGALTRGISAYTGLDPSVVESGVEFGKTVAEAAAESPYVQQAALSAAKGASDALYVGAAGLAGVVGNLLRRSEDDEEVGRRKLPDPPKPMNIPEPPLEKPPNIPELPLRKPPPYQDRSYTRGHKKYHIPETPREKPPRYQDRSYKKYVTGAAGAAAGAAAGSRLLAGKQQRQRQRGVSVTPGSYDDGGLYTSYYYYQRRPRRRKRKSRRRKKRKSRRLKKRKSIKKKRKKSKSRGSRGR